MTEGEILFYLREVHPHWSASNVSSDKLAELEAATLIEITGIPAPVVRLTSEGARRKFAGRRHSMDDGIRLTRKTKTFQRRASKKNVPRARPLV